MNSEQKAQSTRETWLANKLAAAWCVAQSGDEVIDGTLAGDVGEVSQGGNNGAQPIIGFDIKDGARNYRVFVIEVE
jgi:hypothetical protein